MLVSQRYFYTNNKIMHKHFVSQRYFYTNNKSQYFTKTQNATFMLTISIRIWQITGKWQSTGKMLILVKYESQEMKNKIKK